MFVVPASDELNMNIKTKRTALMKACFIMMDAVMLLLISSLGEIESVRATDRI